MQTTPLSMRASLVALATASLLAACPALSFAQQSSPAEAARQAAAQAAREAAKAQAVQDLDGARIAREVADQLRASEGFRLDALRAVEESRAAVASSLDALMQQQGGRQVVVAPQLEDLRARTLATLGDQSLYESGISALDGERWQSAVDTFTRVIKNGKTRVDGALYWKAYALNRLGQRAEAQATLQELFKSHPNSRYLDDARALDIDLKQGSGQSVKPEDQANDELKSIAFSAIMRSDPDRAIPMGQQLLQGRGSPKLKQQILFSLAMNATPKAQDVVAAVARGGQGINPDLQMKAIKYLGVYGRNNTSLLGDVYRGTKDPDVRRQIIRSLGSARDDKQLVTIARSESDTELRIEAIRQLGSLSRGSWVLADGMMATPFVAAGSGSGSGSGIGTATGRTVVTGGQSSRERPKADVAAISDALVQIYRTDKDVNVKKAIIGTFASQQNAKSLVDLARAETNTELKREIVSRLSSMKSKEATDYLMEILK